MRASHWLREEREREYLRHIQIGTRKTWGIDVGECDSMAPLTASLATSVRTDLRLRFP